jgi:hypothetical protein
MDRDCCIMTGCFRPGGAAVSSLGRKPQEYCPETPSPEPRRGGRGRYSAAPPGLWRRDEGLFISWGLRPRLLTAAPSGLGTSNPAPVALLQSLFVDAYRHPWSYSTGVFPLRGGHPGSNRIGQDTGRGQPATIGGEHCLRERSRVAGAESLTPRNAPLGLHTGASEYLSPSHPCLFRRHLKNR